MRSREWRRMIRFSYAETLSPGTLHHYFVVAGAVPHLYLYRPRTDRWTLHVREPDAEAVRQVFDGLGVEFEEQVVTSRFAE